MTEHSVTEREQALRVAAEMRWQDPPVAWEEIAHQIGVARNTLWIWRQEPDWEGIYLQAGREHVETLGPSAVNGLHRAWKKGNPTGAVDALRSLRLLRDENININFQAIALKIEVLVAKYITDPDQRREFAREILESGLEPIRPEGISE